MRLVRSLIIIIIDPRASTFSNYHHDLADTLQMAHNYFHHLTQHEKNARRLTVHNPKINVCWYNRLCVRIQEWYKLQRSGAATSWTRHSTDDMNNQLILCDNLKSSRSPKTLAFLYYARGRTLLDSHQMFAAKYCIHLQVWRGKSTNLSRHAVH
jgi:hypothetical protein